METLEAVATPVSADQAKICEAPIAFDLRLWRRCGRHLSRARGLMQWEIGDWILEAEVHGRMEQKELKKQATTITGLAWGSLKNMAWVSRSIPPSRRRDDLTYSHHREVAKFDEAIQERYLDWAVKNDNDPLYPISAPVSVRILKKIIRRDQESGILPRPAKPEKPTKLPLRPLLRLKCRDQAEYYFFQALAETRKLPSPDLVLWNLAIAYIKQNTNALVAEAATVPGFKEKIEELSRGGNPTATKLHKKLEELETALASHPVSDQSQEAKPDNSDTKEFGCLTPQSVGG